MLRVFKAQRWYYFLMQTSYYSPEIQRQADIRDRAGGVVKMAFDAIDGTIDSMIRTAVFSQCKPSPYREMIEK
jgi:hypothetical protein